MHMMAGGIAFLVSPALELVSACQLALFFFLPTPPPAAAAGSKFVCWGDGLVSTVWLALLVLRLLCIVTWIANAARMQHELWFSKAYHANPTRVGCPSPCLSSRRSKPWRSSLCRCGSSIALHGSGAASPPRRASLAPLHTSQPCHSAAHCVTYPSHYT